MKCAKCTLASELRTHLATEVNDVLIVAVSSRQKKSKVAVSLVQVDDSSTKCESELGPLNSCPMAFSLSNTL